MTRCKNSKPKTPSFCAICQWHIIQIQYYIIVHSATSFWPASSPSTSTRRAAALDTGTPGHAQTAPERTKHQPQKRTRTNRREDSTSGRAAQRSKPEAERQKSQSQHDGSRDTTTSRQPAPEEPQRSSQSQRARSAAL